MHENAILPKHAAFLVQIYHAVKPLLLLRTVCRLAVQFISVHLCNIQEHQWIWKFITTVLSKECHLYFMGHWTDLQQSELSFEFYSTKQTQVKANQHIFKSGLIDNYSFLNGTLIISCDTSKGKRPLPQKAHCQFLGKRIII